MGRILDQETLDNEAFWEGKDVVLPQYDRQDLPVKSLCFSAGRMAYGHTGDILQDLLDQNNAEGTMVGIETYAERYCADLAASDYLMTQLIYENEKGEVTPKIQGAIVKVLYVDENRESLTWKKLVEYAQDPTVRFATINAPEVVYGVTYKGGEFAEPVNKTLIKDIEEGTINSDPAKWTAFAMERYKAGLNFALVSCTNFSANGHYTGATVRAVARGWEERGYAPDGFLAYLSDPEQFSFPNCMIDRIAVPPDAQTQEVMEDLGIESNLVVTERTRYWVVEDIFPAGRPAFEAAEGVIMEPSYEEVKKYEDMKLRILNMAHSTIAGLGVLLGHQGQYGIFRAMQDEDLTEIIDRIIEIVIDTIEWPDKMDPREFAEDTIERLNNPNIPDDPMRIAFNASSKMLPRFMDTYYAGKAEGMSDEELDVVLLPVAGFLRYTLGVDDQGNAYELENDPIREKLVEVGQKAELGNPDSVSALTELIGQADVMGKDLYDYGQTGERLETFTRKMLASKGAVRETVQEFLRSLH
jgi:fructuronate reductase